LDRKKGSGNKETANKYLYLQ